MTHNVRVQEFPDAHAAAASLEDGIELLDEQRQAMLARDAERLEVANARLSAWIAACRATAAPFDPRISQRLDALRAALDSNSALARRSALQASRTLEALIAPETRTYTDEGWTPPQARRRETFSA